MARMRDNLIHRYFGVRYDLVWQIMQEDALFLTTQIPQILSDINRQMYLEYKKSITLGKNNLLSTQYLNVEIDYLIAKAILKEYRLEDRDVAIAKLKDMLSQSDYARQLEKDRTSDLESLDLHLKIRYLLLLFSNFFSVERFFTKRNPI